MVEQTKSQRSSQCGRGGNTDVFVDAGDDENIEEGARSVGDLDHGGSSNPSHHYPVSPTPPAALSTLGARAKMDNPTESGAPFAVSQYDMLHDLSDISTDDHDTASIASRDNQTGQLTPEQTASDFEGEQDKIEGMTLSPDVAVKSKSSDTSQHLRRRHLTRNLYNTRRCFWVWCFRSLPPSDHTAPFSTMSAPNPFVPKLVGIY
ncbi:unnamed protein product [Zymoseptoria tritici ST99CH_1A5]|uniref:Uncharacterized protein n=1 Tax=Zymoseptoria tritici ST99CH_1A5 TaxID=1276529 RepID=A0A1Y6M0X7_ZYMTR|nr:unnamed protein product [Zymoseptoria tritici ST99CH_1A5]